MVRAVMADEHIAETDYSVVPFPVNLPELYRCYVPMDGTFYLTIYDEWGRRKLERFQAMGVKTEVLWVRSPEEKGLSATEVRRRMARGEPWEQMVPPSVAPLLRKWEIPERLRKLEATP
jgi:nicotinamide-nucleotide adenylyltransferase